MWRNKNRKQEGAPEESFRGKIGMGLKTGIRKVQRRFGDTLNKKAEHLSERGKMLLLALVCLLMGGGSLYVMLIGISNEQSAARIKPNAITVPRNTDKTGEGATGLQGLLTDANMRRIQEFRRYMDSLHQSEGGRKVYDSIVHARPGLMDSLSEVERLYRIDSLLR